MSLLKQADFLSNFSCLGDRCADTCCKSWSMQLDMPTRALYQKEAPELLDAIEPAKESDFIMRKDVSGVCVKFEDGLCGIHKNYGDRFLGDACHFYPRATRLLGTQAIMTATLSCPEVVRLMLTYEMPVALIDRDAERLPNTIKNYIPDGMSEQDALSLHQSFIAAAADKNFSAERSLLQIATVSRFLGRIDISSWPQAVGIYFKTADAMIPQPQTNINDPFNLLHALCGLMVASKKTLSDRLLHTISDIEKALHAKLDWQQVTIATQEDSLQAYQAVRALWDSEARDFCEPILKRWLQVQMSLALYPFAGLGNILEERITIIGVRMATLRLALMCAYANDKRALAEDNVVRIIQSLARVLDHLADPTFSLNIYQETGWSQEPRMCGLLH